ncbi:MAG: DUF1593 domain-containing protein, partial [Verrucomicrobia bacterium]|nr:DUF1593 domain-containing protein [Verrucomicrobiota bacterium]
ASFHIFGGAENMGENERGKIDPKFSGSPEVAVPEGKVCLRFSALTKGAMAGMTLKDLKLPNQDPTGEKRGWRGSTPFEEYIADFSTYKDVGKFHFRYWARKGEKFKVQAKIQGIEVVGTGQWESAIIEPLHKELHTHHILMAFQNLNDGPAELYLDDAFYYTGGVPGALIRAREAGRSAAAPAKAAKPRTIVTTDIETDDYNSLIRYLVYASDFETVGLVYGSSEFHWAGDGKGTTFFLPRRPYSTPQTSWRWTGVQRIQELIEDYRTAYPNLKVHDSTYPAPDHLLSLIKMGNVEFEGDVARETEGSNWIKDKLLDDVPGQLFLQAWGGPNTIARALMSIEEQYRDTPQWPAIYRKVSDKAVIYTWGKQDGTYDSYIGVKWPEIQVNDISSNAWGYWTRGDSSTHVLHQDKVYFQSEWTRANVVNVGPLGGKYRVWADGRQFAGDHEDTFGLVPYPGHPLPESLPKDHFISEGDTPAFLNLIDTGLRSHEHPSYGGWGNRLTKASTTQNYWTSNQATERDETGTVVGNYTSKRWVAVAQRDFAARLKWSVTPSFANANHHPVVSVACGLDRTAAPGETVNLAGTGIDPDGNALTYRWWQYREAGTYPGAITFSSATTGASSFVVPADAVSGQTIHAILEVADNGTPALTRWQRVIVTVAPAATKADSLQSTTLDCGKGVEMKFAFIPRGTFFMGSPTSEPHRCPGWWSANETRHEVILTKDYYLGVTEVTREQWIAVMGYDPSTRPAYQTVNTNTGETKTWTINYPDDLRPNKPVMGITRQDAIDFCKKLSQATGRRLRLPTEAEWEHACRAGTRTPFFWGSDPAQAPEYAIFGRPYGQNEVVASRKPNPWGLFDMSGNVWEWVLDYYGDFPSEAQTDPTGPATADPKDPKHSRNMRGGCAVNDVWQQRSACRHRIEEDFRNSVVGFRVLLESEPTGKEPAAYKPNRTSPFIRPETQKLCDHLQNLAAVSKEELARDIAPLAPGGQLKADDQDLARFVLDLVQCLSGKKVSAGNAAVLAGDLEQTLNPGQGSVRQTQGAVRNFAHTLKLAEADHAQADKVGADLTVLAKVPTDPGPFDGPRHPFRFALSEAPRYGKAVLVEDFESGTDIFKTWYQPYWSTGIVATFDSQHKSGGNRGLTISNTGPTTKRSSMAKFPRPHQDLSGCNALRLWFKPHGLKDSEGTVSMGFIDGSGEIWQVDLPEVLSGTEPCVIQVRLGDFRRVLRRNNGRIDLENRDFCFWMTGTYKFTVDDILFVHDPALPEFPKPSK